MNKVSINPATVLTGLPGYWFWVQIPGYVIDWAHPWPDAAIAEAENDGSGFAVLGREIVKGACTWIDYTNKRGETKRIAIAGWQVETAKTASDLASRIEMFGQQTICPMKDADQYGGGIEWDGSLYEAMLAELNKPTRRRK